jgi:hypothetical protein
LPTTISIDSITTEDAAPSAAPHRISSQAGWSTLTVQFTPTHDGAIVPSADLLPTDGTIFPDENYYPDDGWYPDEGAIEPGVVIAQNVGRCSSARVCGSRAALNNACSRESKARTPSGQQIATTFAYADANDGGGDGSRNVNVWALTESQGWS